MRRFLYDDQAQQELIAALKAENDKLVSMFATRIDELRKEFSEALNKLVEKLATQPQAITKESIARSLHIPVSLVDQIDLERLGMQAPPRDRSVGG